MKLTINNYNRAEIMKIIREWTDLTQEDFAKKIGKSKATVRDYEQGRTSYNIDTLLKIAKVFNIKITFEK